MNRFIRVKPRYDESFFVNELVNPYRDDGVVFVSSKSVCVIHGARLYS